MLRTLAASLISFFATVEPAVNPVGIRTYAIRM